jgi:hypothetical protein
MFGIPSHANLDVVCFGFFDDEDAIMCIFENLKTYNTLIE